MAHSQATSHESQSEVMLIPDNEIFPSAQFSKLSVNNHYVDFYNLKKSVDNTLIGILQEHPIAHALTAHADVPVLYLQQFWNSLQYETREAGGFFVGNIERHVVSFNLGFLRHLLQLPVQEEFDEPLPTAELLHDLLVMGYTDSSIKMISKFSRKHLTGIWYNLFGVLAKSLCPSGSGLDKATTNFMVMFHGFCFGRRIDYALCIWNELRESVVRHTGAKAKLFIPYTRFLAIIINNFLERFPAINKRRSSAIFKASVIKFQIKKALAEGEHQMMIPLALLRMARGNPAVEDYIAEHYPAHVVDAPESSADTSAEESNSTKSAKVDESDDDSDDDHHDAGADQFTAPEPSPKRRKIIFDDSDRADEFSNLADYELDIGVSDIAKAYAAEQEADNDSLEVYDSYDEQDQSDDQAKPTAQNVHIRFDSEEEEEAAQKPDDVVLIEDEAESSDHHIPSPIASIPSTSGREGDINWDIRQMNTNDIKLVLFLRLKTDMNVTQEDVTLANLIAEQNRFTESQWKADLTDTMTEFDKRQTAKFEELKDDLGVVMSEVLNRLKRIEETCKATASTATPRKDDDDHEDDPTAAEGEKKKDTAGTSAVDQSTSIEKEKPSQVQYERRFKRTDISKVFLTIEERKKVLDEVFGESSEEEAQEVTTQETAKAERAAEHERLQEETIDRSILSQVFDRLKQQAAYAQQHTEVPPTITYTEEDRQKILEENRRVNEAFEQLVKEKKEEKKRMAEEEERRAVMGYVPPVDYTWSLEYHLQRLEEQELMKAKEEEEERMKREEEQRMVGFRPWDQRIKAIKPKEKKFEKASAEELILDACKKDGRFHFTNNAYMEDNFKEMFVSKSKILSMFKLHLIDDWPRAKKLKWKNALNEARKPDDEIRSRHKIVNLINASPLHCQNFTLYQVEVTRDDGKFYMLSEADFPHMDLKDIDKLYELLREIPVNTGPYQNLRTAVRRFMKFKINDMCCHDFQMGMECSQPFLNLTPPRHHIEKPSTGARMFEVNTIGRQLGIYYPSEDDSERFFMLKDDLHKFSDGTLKIININLAAQIVKVDFPNKDLKAYESEVYHQQRVLEMQAAVKKRLSDRVHAREFEVYFGLRERQQTLD